MCARELYVDEDVHRLYKGALVWVWTIHFAVRSVARSSDLAYEG